MDDRFTEEELRVAKSVDLTAVASQLGYTVKRVGKRSTLFRTLLFLKLFQFS